MNDFARNIGPLLPLIGIVALLSLLGLLLLVAWRFAAFESGRLRTASASGSMLQAPLPTLLYLSVPLVTLVLIAAVAALLEMVNAQADITLPLLLSAGVVLLLMGLVATTVVFRELRLTDSNEALGLPKGSVRAVMALLLILIFAIMTIHLYSRTGAPQVFELRGLTQAQVDQIPVLERRAVRDDAATDRFIVERILPRTAADDMAKQIITTVSTLVVAISAFYFGSNSVQAAQEGLSGGRAPRILARPNTTRLRKKDGGWEPVDVSLTTAPAGMEVRAEVVGDASGALRRRGDSNLYVYDPVEPQATTRLRFQLVGHPDVSAELVLEQEQGTTTGA